jgi:ribosomal protein L30E
MAAKKIMEEIKEALTKKKIIIGTTSTLKKLKMGKVAKVYVSNNCPNNVMADLDRFKKSAEIEVLDKSNEELGIVCKKPFSISVLSILGEAKKSK